MNPGLVLCAVLSYAIGTIPTAWLIMKRTHGIDIREHGTGNVGAMNTFDVSGSKALGIVTMLLDALKGVAAVAMAQFLFGGQSDGWFLSTAVAAPACILGHNYNILLRGKGGRGLATATGAFAWMNPFVIVLWDIMYLTGYFAIRRNVHVGAMTGTIGLAILIWSTPDVLLRMTTLVPLDSVIELRLSVFVCCIVIFLRHLQPLRDLFAADAAAADGDQDA